MVYESTVNFTFDTICPWTYLAKKRLDKALEIIRAKETDVTFTLHLHPYQLYPSFPKEPTPKSPWYLHEKYSSSPALLSSYITLMQAYGTAEGISFSFEGTISNTLPAHRVLQSVQERFGEEMAEKVLMGLYRRYFEEERDPADREVLVESLREAGVAEGVAGGLVGGDGVGGVSGSGGDGSGKGAEEAWGMSEREVQSLIREQASNGIDAVPYVVVEGKRRDFTLEGCKEVAEYVRVLEGVVRECK